MKAKINMDEIVISPIGEKDLMVILARDSYRNDFINKYTFFKTDGHEQIYKAFIENIDINKKNDRIDDAIILADNIGYFSESILHLVEKILLSKKSFFLKLTCLDYLLSQQEKVKIARYIVLNERYKNNSNDFLRLQSNINLLITNQRVEAEKNLIRLLKSVPYPNIFYRFFNSILFNVPSFKGCIDSQFIRGVLEIFERSKFSQESKDEIIDISTMLIKELEDIN